MPTPQDIVRAYCALWNENDADVRAQLLDLCWDDDGSNQIGERTVAGRRAVAADIERFRARCPNDKAVLTSDIAFAGRWFRFSAEVRRLDGSVYSRMLDVGELAPDGRIVWIVTFPAE